MVDIFNKLITNDLTPNQFYFLWCKQQSISPTFNISVSLEYTRLKNGGWLDDEEKLSSKSLMLLQEINSFFKNSKKKTSTQLMGKDFGKMIDEYSEIFPKLKLPSGKYARADKKNLENAFRWFFDNHNYNWSTIIAATKLYVDTFERQGYKYMRTSQYFIRKTNTAERTFESELADYCNMYINGGSDYEEKHFSERVV
jgi:hypothetical protein